MLLATTHQDTASAAYSIVTNRASKVRKLLTSASTVGIAQPEHRDALLSAATRNADSLVFDVLEFIANGDALADPRLGQELANLAITTRDAVRDAADRKGTNAAA